MSTNATLIDRLAERMSAPSLQKACAASVATYLVKREAEGKPVPTAEILREWRRTKNLLAQSRVEFERGLEQYRRSGDTSLRDEVAAKWTAKVAREFTFEGEPPGGFGELEQRCSRLSDVLNDRYRSEGLPDEAREIYLRAKELRAELVDDIHRAVIASKKASVYPERYAEPAQEANAVCSRKRAEVEENIKRLREEFAVEGRL